MSTNKVFRVEGEVGIDLKGFLSELKEARKMVREELFAKITKKEININFKINNTALEQNLKTAHKTVKDKIKTWEENTLKLNVDFNKEKLKTRVDSLVAEVRRGLEQKMKINFRFEPESRNNAVKDFEDLSQQLNEILRKNVYIRPKIEVDKQQLGKALDIIENEIQKRDLGKNLNIVLDENEIKKVTEKLQDELKKGLSIHPTLDIDEKDPEIKAALKTLKKKLRGIVGDNLEIYPTIKFKKDKNVQKEFISSASEYYKKAGEKIGEEIGKNIKILPKIGDDVYKEIVELIENNIKGKAVVLQPRFKLSSKTNFNHIFKNLEDAFEELGKNLAKIIEQNLETRPKIKPYVDFDEDNLKSELFQISARISKLLEEDLVLKPHLDLSIDKFLKSSIEKFRFELKKLLEAELTITPKVKIDRSQLRDLLDDDNGSGSPPNKPPRNNNSSSFFNNEPNRNNIFNRNNDLPITRQTITNRINSNRLRNNVRTGNNFDNFSYVTLSDRGLSTNVIEKVPIAMGLTVLSIQKAVELLVAGFEKSLELAERIVEVAVEGFNRYLNLDESIQTVRALSVTDEVAPTPQEIELLKQTIKDTAISLPLTLQEISDGVIILKRAGADIDQIVGSYISAVAKAAVATGENFELLSDVATSADVAFENADILTILDKLSFAANESKLEFNDLAQSIKALKGIDIGIDNFSVLNQLLADIGIRGGTAGTAIRNFVNFATKKAGELKNTFNIDVFNPDGSIKDVLDIVIQISQLLPKLNDVAKFQLGNIFGERGQVIIQAINNLSTDELLNKYEDLGKSIGLIDEQVNIMMDGISGSQKQLLANLDTLLAFDIGQGLENLGIGFIKGLNFIIEQISSDGKLKNSLKEIGNNFYAQIFDESGNINTNAQKSLTTLAEGIQNIFVRTIDSIVNFISTALNNPESVIKLVAIFENIFNTVINLISFVLNNIDQINNVLGFTYNVLNKIQNNIGLFINQITQVFNLINGQEITSIVSSFVSDFEKLSKNNFNSVINFIESLSNINVGDFGNIDTLINNFKDILNIILDYKINLEPIHSFIEDIKTGVSLLKLETISIFETIRKNPILETITSSLKSVIDFIISGLKFIKELVSLTYRDVIKPLITLLISRMEPIIESILVFVNGLLESLSFVFETLTNIFNHITKSLDILKIMDTVGRLITNTTSLLLNAVEVIFRTVGGLLTILFKISSALKTQEIAGAIISAGIVSIMVTLQSVFEIINFIVKLIDSALTNINKTLDILQDAEKRTQLLSDIWLAIKQTVNDILQAINRFLLKYSNDWEIILNDINIISTSISNTWTGFISTIKSGVSLLDEFLVKLNLIDTKQNRETEKELKERIKNEKYLNRANINFADDRFNSLVLRVEGSPTKYEFDEAEMNRLLAVALLESSEDSKEGLRGRVGVIQAVINRLVEVNSLSDFPRSDFRRFGYSLTEQLFAPEQFAPLSGRDPNEFKTKQNVIDELVKQGRYSTKEAAEKAYVELLNTLVNDKVFVQEIAELIGGRNYFKSANSPNTLPPRPGDPVLGGNYFHEETHQSSKTLREIFSRTSGAIFELGESIKDAGENFLIHGAKIEDILKYEPLPGQGEFAARDGGSRRHSGLDFDSTINAIPGTPIYNVIPGGRVEQVYTADSQGFQGVRIAGLDANGNEIYTALNHLKNLQVAVGDILEFGQQVGDVGWHHLDFKARINDQQVFVKDFLKAIYDGQGDVKLLDGGSLTINLNGNNDLNELPLFPGAEAAPSNPRSGSSQSLDQRIANIRNNIQSSPIDQALVDKINQDALLSLQEESDKKLKKIKLPGITSINESDLGLNIDGDDSKTIREFNKYLEQQLETRRELLKTVQREYETRIDLVTDTLLNTEDPLQRSLLEQEKSRLELQKDLNLKTQQRLFYMQDIEKLGELTNQGLLDYVKKYQELIDQNEREVAEAFYQADRETNKTIIQTLNEQIDSLKESSKELQTSLSRPQRSETQVISDEIERILEKYEKLNSNLETYQDYINNQLDSSTSLNDIQRSRLELQQEELRIVQFRLAKEQRISLEYLNQLNNIIQKRDELERESTYNEIEINRLRLESQLANEVPWGADRANELSLEADKLERELELKQRLFEIEQRRFELETIYSDDPEKLSRELELLSAKEIALQNQFLLQEKIVQQQIYNASIWGQIRNTLYQNIEQSLADIILQTKSVGDAFKSMVNEILSLIIRSGIRKLLSSLFSGLFGSGGGGVLGFNSGGFVRSGVAANIDSVPALLTRGEYVLNRRAVESIGVKTLDALNRNYSTIKKYNAGGLVTSEGLSNSMNSKNQQQRFVFETIKIGEQEFVSTEQLSMFENRMNRKIINSQQETTASVYEGMVKSNSLRQRLRI